MATVQKTKVNDLVAWEHKKQQLENQIAAVKEEIKIKTDGERARMKNLRGDLKLSKWKIGELLGRIKEATDFGDVESVLTLDDFSDREIDLELARAEMRAATKKAE